MRTSKSDRTARMLALLVLAGLVLRTIWALLVPVQPLSDSMAYETFATNIAQHGVFGWRPSEPFSFWPPGTSIIYAPAYLAKNLSHTLVVAINLILSALLIIFSYRVGNRFFGSRIAIITAAVMAMWPTLVLYSTIIASELPYIVLTVIALDLWTNAEMRLSLRAVLAGVFLGLAALTRPLALLLPVVFAISCLLPYSKIGENVRHQAKLLVIAGLAMSAVILPWTVRNYDLYGEVVLISTNGGVTLWMGNTPGTNGAYMATPAELEGLRDVDQNRILRERARDYILEEPGAFLLRSIRKLVQLYSNESIGVAWNEAGITKSLGEGVLIPLKRFTQICWAGLLGLALVGFVVCCKRQGVIATVLSPIALSIAFYSGIYSVTVSQDRYHLSFASQVGILAAIGIVALLDKYLHSSTNTPGAPII